jgi:hypothetical protein
MIRDGRLKLRTYDEISQLIGDTAEFKLFDSYMNVWAKRAGTWQLLARHVGVIQRGKPEPLE